MVRNEAWLTFPPDQTRCIHPSSGENPRSATRARHGCSAGLSPKIWWIVWQSQPSTDPKYCLLLKFNCRTSDAHNKIRRNTRALLQYIGLSLPDQGIDNRRAPDNLPARVNITGLKSGKQGLQLRDQVTIAFCKILQATATEKDAEAPKTERRRGECERGHQQILAAPVSNNARSTTYTNSSYQRYLSCMSSWAFGIWESICPPYVLWEDHLLWFSRRGVRAAENSSEVRFFVWETV